MLDCIVMWFLDLLTVLAKVHCSTVGKVGYRLAVAKFKSKKYVVMRRLLLFTSPVSSFCFGDNQHTACYT